MKTSMWWKVRVVNGDKSRRVTLEVIERPTGYIALMGEERYWVKHDPNGDPSIDARKPIPAVELKA